MGKLKDLGALQRFTVRFVSKNMNLVGKSEFRWSPSREGVVTGDTGKVPRVVECKDADVAPAADLKAVDSAVRCDDPRGLFGVPPDRTHEVKSHKADRTGMRKDRDPAAHMVAENLP